MVHTPPTPLTAPTRCVRFITHDKSLPLAARSFDKAVKVPFGEPWVTGSEVVVEAGTGIRAS